MSEHKRERDGMMDDKLADEQPIVLESSETDPIFPANSEYEVDEGGWQGTHDPKSGLLWAGIALVALLLLVIFCLYTGDWH